MVNDRIWILLARKLSGEASQTELQELELLQAKQPGTNTAIKQITAQWTVHPEADADFLEATYLLHLERMKDQGYPLNSDDTYLKQFTGVDAAPAPQSKSYNRTGIGLLSLLVVVVLCGIFISTKNSGPDKKPVAASEEIETQNGTRTKILLPDGSGVWLNSGSKLSYTKNFNAGPREVYLTGEAFFDVVKNTSRPFIIHTNKIDVKVTGTQFNVKAYSNDKTTETSLIRGSVEVMLRNDSSTKYVLRPNDKLILQNEVTEPKQKIQSTVANGTPPLALVKQLTHIKDSNADVETSWTRNILSFEDEPFFEVANKMERWYNVHFVFKNKKWEQQYLSGSFEEESLKQAMDALRFSTGFNYKIESNNVTIY